jgi:hypothetical protein
MTPPLQTGPRSFASARSRTYFLRLPPSRPQANWSRENRIPVALQTDLEPTGASLRRAMDAPTLEHAIRRIPGVEAARVVMNGPAPSEVHVLTVPGKAPKQVVRDVQSVAMASLGIPLDRRIVSVVQLDGTDIGGSDRPAIEDLAEEIDGSRMTITVTLAWKDQKLVGRATGPAAATTRMRVIAEATLSALEEAFDDQAALAISAVHTPRIGGHDIAVAVIVIVSGGEELVVTGSALSGADPSRSMVRAVLDGLNRQVPNLKRT